MPAPPALIAAYLRKRADLVRFFAARTGSAAEGEDLVQELFLKIEGAAVSEDIRSPEAYLYRLGSNLMLDRMKQRRRQGARDEGWRRVQGGDGPDPVADAPAADDVVASRQRFSQLLAAIDELPPQTAKAFRLHKFDGLSHAEVAARLGVSRSSVEKYILTALRHLLARLEP